MDQRQQDPAEEPAGTGRKASWSKPEVDRFQAGGAEASDGADTDGATLS